MLEIGSPVRSLECVVSVGLDAIYPEGFLALCCSYHCSLRQGLEASCSRGPPPPTCGGQRLLIKNQRTQLWGPRFFPTICTKLPLQTSPPNPYALHCSH